MKFKSKTELSVLNDTEINEFKLYYINSSFEFVKLKDANEDAELNLENIVYNNDNNIYESGSSDI